MAANVVLYVLYEHSTADHSKPETLQKLAHVLQSANVFQLTMKLSVYGSTCRLKMIIIEEKEKVYTGPCKRKWVLTNTTSE